MNMNDVFLVKILTHSGKVHDLIWLRDDIMLDLITITIERFIIIIVFACI